MSASGNMRSCIENRFININSLPWSRELPEVYEKFSTYCRASALAVAREGNFNDAFSIANLMESLWVLNETPSTWTSFYTDIAKAILSQQQQHEAVVAVRNYHRFKPLQAIVKELSPSDFSRLSIFLEKCK